jgi:hypothetical protein
MPIRNDNLHKLIACFVALFLCTLSCLVQAENDISPKLYPADKAKPIEIIAEKIWTAADEEPKNGHNVISNEKYHNPNHLPLGQGTRYNIATFKPEASKGPVKLILDYAGTAENLAKNPDKGVVVVNVALICPESPELDYCQRSRRIHSWTQDITYPFYRDKPSQDSQKPALYTSHSYLEYDFAPNKPITIAISFNAPAYANTHQLKTTLIYGDYALTPPPMFKIGGGYIGIGKIGKSIAIFALLALLFLWIIKLISKQERNSDAPKISGILVTIWALLLAVAGCVSDNMSYYLVTGVIFAYSGLYLFSGQQKALWIWGAGLVTAWVWSIMELGFVFKPLLMQVGFITLLSLYIFSNRITERLEFSTDE